MSGECERCGEHALECKCIGGGVEFNNEYRGKCEICEEYLGESIAIYAGNQNSLRHLKQNQKAHLDCYIDLCIEKKLNSLEH